MTSEPRTTADDQLRSIVADVLAELGSQRGSAPSAGMPPAPLPASSAPSAAVAATSASTTVSSGPTPHIELGDPILNRRAPGIPNPANPAGLTNLIASTGARIGVGRAGPRPLTRSLLLFQADHAVTQDAIFGDVPQALLERFGMFAVQTQVTTHDEFLLRPDLGRRLTDEAKATIGSRCTKNPNVQVVVGDGLSAAAVTNNLDKIYPVLVDGFRSAGLSLGDPFFIRYCRVGVINDLNTVIGADVVVLLIGERPGLGVADALSVYSGWQPGPGKTDADRDVVCMITENGGTNPMEAGAFVVEHIRKVIAAKASGVALRTQGGDS